MIDQNPKFFPNIRGMRPRIFSCNRFHIMGSLVVRPADGSERGDARAPGGAQAPSPPQDGFAVVNLLVSAASAGAFAKCLLD
jgi:hypothetical protein